MIIACVECRRPMKVGDLSTETVCSNCGYRFVPAALEKEETEQDLVPSPRRGGHVSSDDHSFTQVETKITQVVPPTQVEEVVAAFGDDLFADFVPPEETVHDPFGSLGAANPQEQQPVPMEDALTPHIAASKLPGMGMVGTSLLSLLAWAVLLLSLGDLVTDGRFLAKVIPPAPSHREVSFDAGNVGVTSMKLVSFPRHHGTPLLVAIGRSIKAKWKKC